jgi:hypothetical protein
MGRIPLVRRRYICQTKVNTALDPQIRRSRQQSSPTKSPGGDTRSDMQYHAGEKTPYAHEQWSDALSGGRVNVQRGLSATSIT